MNGKILNILNFIAFVIFAALLGWATAAGYNSLNKNNETEACVKSACYKVELARNDRERARGLMLREKLGKDRGMLFEFERDGVYSFWMKNTLIPLDMVWIGADKKIVFISSQVAPCAGDPCPAINPGIAARWVLEVNAGEMERLGAKIGDIVAIEPIK